MRRWAIPVCGAAIISAILILATPHLLARHSLQQYLLHSVEQALGVKTHVESMGWRWLPLPALTITGLKADGAPFAVMAPEARLTLHPRSMLQALLTATGKGPSANRTLFSARLINPEFTIKQTESAAHIPAFGLLTLINGRVTIPAEARAERVNHAAITLSAVNGKISSSARLLHIDIHAGSSFARSLSIKGSLDPRQGAFQFDLKGSGLASDALSDQPPMQDSWLPVVRDLAFTAHLAGDAADRFQLQVSSQEAPFTVAVRGQTFTIARVDGLTIRRQGASLAISGNELALSQPRLRLQGHVRRTMSSATPTPIPVWSIDLNGQDLDLGAIRARILDLFGQHPVAQEVCAIVGGGGAESARYTFTGPTADFHHLRSMGIWAEARDVPVTIPTINLSLDRASGPIAIVNGQLSGHGLTATIEQSQGKNGELLLDLEKDRHGFTLDLDLDADLNNLHHVLSRIIPSPRFQEELGHFSAIKGRAQGHLHLGDQLHHLETRVEVRQAEGSGRYDRLPWPFTIQAGQLRVAPNQVTWDGVTGTLGQQRINAAKGEVTWQDEVHLALQALDADLDLHPLLSEGTLRTNRTTIALKDFIHGRFDDVAGTARLTDTTLSGPVNRPRQWRYHGQIKAGDLRITTSGLPLLHNGEMEAEISEQQVSFAGIFDLIGQGLFLSGRYRHRLLEGWHGDLEINGDIGEHLGAWIKAKGIIPAAAFPILPVRVERVVISNPEPGFGAFTAHGQVMALPRESDAVLTLAINRQRDRTMSTFIFAHGRQQGTLIHQTFPGPGERSLLSWQGELDIKPLSALFPLPFVDKGRIRGACSRLSDQGKADYMGEVELTGVGFTPLSLTPELTIDTLHLRGQAKEITVDQAEFAVAGTKATVAGKILEAEGLHTLDLHLTTPQLAWASINKAFTDFASKRTPAERQSTVNSLRGTIALDIGSFAYTRPAPTQKGVLNAGEKGHTFFATPLQGAVRLTETGMELAIDKATVCGISGHGTWLFGGAQGDDTVTFSSGPAPLSFVQTLPCLGIKQSLIIGPFSVHGQLQGRPKAWRHGSLTLTSAEGLIKRMNLLSKIFTHVNFTDYFTWQDLPDVEDEGLYYNDLAINAHIAENRLVLDRTIVKGRGVNLSGRGTIGLSDLDSDLTFFIAPLKIIDSLLTNIPLIGKALAGPKESILTFPVTVTGNLLAPEVTSLAPEAVGSAFFEMFKDTLTLPFRILQPDEVKGQGREMPATPGMTNEPQP